MRIHRIVAALAVVVVMRRTSYADAPPSAPAAARYQAKKDLTVNFYNTWTDEWLAIDPESYAKELRLPKPRFTPDAPVPQPRYDDFLRCHFTNEATHTEPRLPIFALAAALHFRAPIVEVVSAFRHPKYNLMLRKKGHQVARDSQHTFGHAIDFRLRGVTVQALHKWAVDQKRGGVGFYLESKFIHMDVGPVRYWNGE